MEAPDKGKDGDKSETTKSSARLFDFLGRHRKIPLFRAGRMSIITMNYELFQRYKGLFLK